MPNRSVPIDFGLPEPNLIDAGGFRVMEGRFAPALALPSHFHEWASVFVVVDGAFTESFRARTYECAPATVMAKPPGERHSNRFGSAGARVIALGPHGLRAELFDSLVPDEVRHFSDGRAAALARDIAAELRTADAVSALAVEGLALEVLAVVARRGGEAGAARRPPRWLLQAAELLHDRFAERLRAAEVAAAVGVHPVHLARVFRATYGVSLGEYVRRLRLRWAAARLTTSDERISEIALGAGFSDQSHLTRAFRRYAGTTPNRYRQARGR